MNALPIEQWFRFCPRCQTPTAQLGSIPFRCPQCGFANFFGPVTAVGGLIIDDQDRLLLVRRARNPGLGKWGMPGGFVDRNETLESALFREVLEETNLRVIETRYLLSLPNDYNYQGVIAPVTDAFFICRVDNADEIRLAPDELDHFEWVSDPFPSVDHMAFNSNRLAILHWWNNRG
jgi:ADP-ribose pyrophosphatase YjhB (NUDIX family)